MSEQVRIEGGQLIYGFPVGHGFSGVDAIDVFVDDYLVGSEMVLLDEQTGEASARIGLHSLPSLTFPAVFRGVIRDRNEEQPIAVIESFEDLLKQVGPTRASAQIVGVQPDRLRCEVDIETLPSYPREFVLFVNNVRAAAAMSVPGKHENRATVVRHKLDFDLAAILRDSDYIEIVEQMTSTVILAMTITWLSLMGPVLSEMRSLRKDVKKAIAQGEELRSRLEVLASVTNEKFFLDRLDLYYFLMSDRLDREMKSIHAMIAPPAGEAVETPPPPGGSRRYAPSEIEGVGFHNLESSGSGEWRWFGPKVTLIFKDIKPGARQLRLSFSQVAAGVDVGLLRGTIDGVEVQPTFRAAPGLNEVFFPLYRRPTRPDRAMIARIEFPGGVSSATNSRVLSAAFREAEIVDE